MPAVRLPVSFFSRQIPPLAACKWQTVLIYAYYKWFACKSSRRFSVKINSRTDKIWYNKINLLEEDKKYQTESEIKATENTISSNKTSIANLENGIRKNENTIKELEEKINKLEEKKQDYR